MKKLFAVASLAICTVVVALSQQLPNVGNQVPNGVCAQELGPDCPQITGPTGVNNFTPASISGLVAAWLPDQGVTASAPPAIDSIAGAFGTTVSLTGTTSKPTVATALGPQNQNLVKLTKASVNFFTTSSALTFTTSMSACWVQAYNDSAAIQQIFGNSAATQGQIRLQSSVGTSIGNLQIATTNGGAVNISMTAGIRPYRNLVFLCLVYDATGAGTATAYVNGRQAGTTAAANSGGSGFSFNRIGVSGAAANPFDGYVLPAMLYNVQLTPTNISDLTNFVAPYLGSVIYVANGGSNAVGTAFWNKSQPLQTPQYAFSSANLPILGTETFALKPNSTFRITAFLAPDTSGVSSTQRVTVDGAYPSWGLSGKAQIRGSTTPICVAVGVPTGPYDCGDATAATSTASTISGTTLTIGGVVTGSYGVGQFLSGTGITAGTKITACSPCGGAGTYTINNSQVVASTAINGIAAPPAFLYYIPNGTLAFGTNYVLGSMQRLTNATIATCSDLTTPGTWGIGGTHICANAGVAISGSEIELSVSTNTGFLSGFANGVYRNVVGAFMPATTVINGANNNFTVDGVEAYFGQEDGIDSPPGATATWDVRNTVVAWIGTGPSSTGGSAGDCYSMHGGTVSITNAVGAWCDKEIHGHLDNATVTVDRSLAIGPLAYRQLNSTGGGSLTVTNSVAVLSVTGPQVAWAVTNSSSSRTVTARFNTVYCLSAGVGIGVYQAGAGAMSSTDNIVQNCATGMQRDAGTFTSDYDNVFGNTTAYSGISAGSHSKAANSLFVTPPTTPTAGFNFSLQSTSPLKGAGVAVSGVVVDYTGATRANPPSIGAYN